MTETVALRLAVRLRLRLAVFLASFEDACEMLE